MASRASAARMRELELVISLFKPKSAGSIGLFPSVHSLPLHASSLLCARKNIMRWSCFTQLLPACCVPIWIFILFSRPAASNFSPCLAVSLHLSLEVSIDFCVLSSYRAPVVVESGRGLAAGLYCLKRRRVPGSKADYTNICVVVFLEQAWMAWNDKYLKAAQSEEKHDSAVPLFTQTVFYFWLMWCKKNLNWAKWWFCLDVCSMHHLCLD